MIIIGNTTQIIKTSFIFFLLFFSLNLFSQSKSSPATCVNLTVLKTVGKLSTPSTLSPSSNQTITTSGSTAKVNIRYRVDRKTAIWRVQLYKGTSTPKWSYKDGFECSTWKPNGSKVTHYKKSSNSVNFYLNLTPGTYWITCHSFKGGLGQSRYSTKRKFIVKKKSSNFSVSISTYTAPCNGGSKTVNVISSSSWTVSGNKSWIKIRKYSKSFKITVSKGSTVGRSGTIEVKSGGKTKYISVIQNACSSNKFSISPSSINTNCNSTSKSIRLTALGNWVASENYNWVSLSKKSGNGNSSFTVNLTKNTGSSNRSGTIKIKNGGITKYITLSQSSCGSSSFSVSPTSINTNCNITSKGVRVTASGSWSASENYSWISLSKTNGSGNGNFTVSLTKNPSSNARNGSIKIVSKGKSKYIKVSQISCGSNTFSISPSSLNINCNTTSKSISVTATGTWSISENYNWISLSKKSSSGNGVFNILIDENKTNSNRNASVKVNNGSSTKLITISQSSGCKRTFVDIEEIRFFADDISENNGVFTLKNNVYSISKVGLSPLPIVKRSFDMVEWLGTTEVTPKLKTIQAVSSTYTSKGAIEIYPVNNKSYYIPMLTNSSLGSFKVLPNSDKFKYNNDNGFGDLFEKAAGFPIAEPVFQLKNSTTSNANNGLWIATNFKLPDVLKDFDSLDLKVKLDDFNFTRSGLRKKASAMFKGGGIGPLRLGEIKVSYDNTAAKKELITGSLKLESNIINAAFETEFINRKINYAKIELGNIKPAIKLGPINLTGGLIKMDYIMDVDNIYVKLGAKMTDASGLIKGVITAEYKAGIGLKAGGTARIDKFVPSLFGVDASFMYLPDHEWFSTKLEANLKIDKSVFKITAKGEMAFGYGKWDNSNSIFAYADLNMSIKDKWIGWLGKKGSGRLYYQYLYDQDPSIHKLNGILEYGNDDVYAFRIINFSSYEHTGNRSSYVYQGSLAEIEMLKEIFKTKEALFSFNFNSLYFNNTAFCYGGPSALNNQVSFVPVPKSNTVFFNISESSKGKFVRIKYSNNISSVIIESLKDTIFNLLSNNNINVEKFHNTKDKTLVLKFDKLVAGDYKISTIGADSVEVISQINLPQVKITYVKINGTTLNVKWKATADDKSSNIRLYLNPESHGVLGVPIDTILTKDLNKSIYNIDLAAIGTGTFYLTVVHTDSFGYVSYDKWPSKLTIQGTNPYSKTPIIKAQVNDTSIFLDWSNIVDNKYYYIYYTDNGEAVDYSSKNFGVFDSYQYNCKWLSPGRQYRFRVCASDDKYKLGSLSNEVIVNYKSSSINNSPFIYNKKEVINRCFRNEVYLFNVKAKDLDGDNIKYSIISNNSNALTISTNGEIKWTPNKSDSIFQSVIVRVNDGKGGQDSLIYKLHVLDSTNKCGFIGLDRVVYTHKNQHGILKTFDYDRKDQNPLLQDTFRIKLWSDSDLKGIWVEVRETEKNACPNKALGWFSFNNKKSIGNSLKVLSGDKIYAYYNDKSCKDSTLTIGFYQEPKSQFKILNDSACSGEEVLFGNYSEGENLKYIWDFGDGVKITGSRHISHIFNVGDGHGFDSFSVKLNIIDDFNTSELIEKIVHIKRKPKIEFLNNKEVCSFDTIILKSKITSSEPVMFNWRGQNILNTNVDSLVYALPQKDTFYILEVTERNWCSNIDTTFISVKALPISGFTLDTSRKCLLGNNFKYTSTSTSTDGKLDSFIWIFDDGKILKGDNKTIEYTYDSSGSYDASLIVYSEFGCKDTFVKPLIVHPMPVAIFNVKNNCVKNNKNKFNNLSTIKKGRLNYKWFFGDGKISALKTPVYSYKTPKTYNPTLMVTSEYNCADTTEIDLVINPTPKMSFAINDTSQCINKQDFLFSSTSIILSGSLSRFKWFFNDGDSSNSKKVNHSFNNVKNYKILHVVVSDSGCIDSLVREIILRPKPNSKFSLNKDKQCLNKNEFLIKNESTIKYGLLKQLYLMGDGSSAHIKNPFKSYSKYGEYSIKLVDTSNFGCLDSFSMPISVYPTPNPDFILNDSAQCLNTNKFIGTNKSSIHKGKFSSSWNFGNGMYSILHNPNFTYDKYDKYGTYKIMLRTTSGYNCKDSIEKIVTIHPVPQPKFLLQLDEQCEGNNKYEYINNTFIYKGKMIFNWDYSDGNKTGVKNGINTFAKYGKYKVKLIVTSDKKCKDSLIKISTVHPLPRINFAVNDSNQCVNDNFYKFTNKSTIPYGKIDFIWDFNNGTKSSLINANTHFVKEGNYKINIIGISNHKCRNEKDRQITIDPIAGINITVDSVCLNSESKFMDISSLSKGSKAAWQWTFNDGKTSISQNPSHVYLNANTYTVNLKIITDNGCVSDSSFDNVAHVESLPIADFIYERVKSGDKNTFMKFNSKSTDDINWNWDFGNGTTSHLQNYEVEYTDTGTYCIKLEVGNWFGCKHDIFKCINIFPVHKFFKVNAFSPNGDGLNDYFGFNGTSYFQKYNMKIYNRWGALIFESNNFKNKWDGKLNGEYVQPGAYFYLFGIQYIDGLRHNYKGTINIIK